MYKGIDCASKLTAAAAARARTAGFDFAGRYLVPNSGSLAWKALTKSEAEAITGAGLRLLTVYESSADRARQGAAAGASDGAAAWKCARDIGMPEDGIIYFAVDYDAPVSDFASIAAYLNAAQAQCVPYHIGVYGSYRVVEDMAERGVCRGYWQCVAWSGTDKSPHRTVYQSDWSGTKAAKAAQFQIGVAVDLNECEDLDRAGIWTYEHLREEPKKAETSAGESKTMDVPDIDAGNIRSEGATVDATKELLENPEVLRALVEKLLETMTPIQAYEVLKRAQEHAAGLPLPEWATGDRKEAKEYAAAKEAGITDGTRPMAPVTRLEAALMAWRARK